MNKRFAAGFLATASTAAVLALPMASASAAPQPCGTYPPGLQYALQIVPASAQVRIGTIIATRGTLRRGGQGCVGYPIGLYTKPADRADFRLLVGDTTDSTGSMRRFLPVKATFRMYYNIRLNSTTNVRSRTSEFVARPR